MSLDTFFTALAQAAPRCRWEIGGEGLRGRMDDAHGEPCICCPLTAAYLTIVPDYPLEAEDWTAVYCELGLTLQEASALVDAADNEDVGTAPMRARLLAAVGLQEMQQEEKTDVRL